MREGPVASLVRQYGSSNLEVDVALQAPERGCDDRPTTPSGRAIMIALGIVQLSYSALERPLALSRGYFDWTTSKSSRRWE